MDFLVVLEVVYVFNGIFKSCVFCNVMDVFWGCWWIKINGLYVILEKFFFVVYMYGEWNI